MVAAAVGAGIVGVAGIIGTVIQTEAQKKAAATAAAAANLAGTTQSASAQAAIDQQKTQFDSMQKLMAPWVNQGTQALGQLGQYEAAGSDALKRQRALMGLDGVDAQRAAIEGISGSAEMQAMIGQGEDAMRQQGAATGGLRGGNFQGALAQFRPQVLSNLINQQYGKLGGLIDMGQGITMNRAALGQASATGVGSAGMQNASSISNLLMQQGNAIAGGQLGAGNAYAKQQMAAGNAWAQVPNYFLQGASFGLGFGGNPSAQASAQASPVSSGYGGGVGGAGGLYPVAPINVGAV